MSKIGKSSLLNKYREFWRMVAEQPPWTQPIWKFLLVLVPVFIIADILLILYVIAVLIMRSIGVTPPAFW